MASRATAGRPVEPRAPATATPAEELTADALVPEPTTLQRYERLFLPTVTIVAILALWELYGQVTEINPLFFSYPSRIFTALVEWVRGPFFGDLATSATEFGIGMLIGLLGIPLGLVIGSVRRLEMAFDPIINGLYSTPMLALTPLFVIWFGLGIASKVAVVALMALFPLLINTAEGVTTVDRNLVRAAQSFGANRLQTYVDVIFPSTVPFIVSGMRLAIGRAIVGVVIGEFIAAVDGVGYRIRATAGVFNTPAYLAGVAVLIVASVLLNLLLKRLEKRLAPWRAGQRAGA